MYNMVNICTLYVSQKYGHDQNQGYEKKAGVMGPLKTVEDALGKIAELRAFGAEQPITVKIIDEVYNVEKPIVIDNSVSSVTIEPAENTLLCGGIRVTGFKEDMFNGVKCFSVDLSGLGNLEFSDFYVNGKAASLTKYPEEGVLTAEDVENNSSELFAGSKWFIAKEEDFKIIKSFKNLNDCHISFNHYWIDEHTPIESFDVETRKITFKYVSRFTIEPTHEASKLRYIIENVAETFKNPNEWYYDRTTGKLYYIPENPDTKEEIEGFIPVSYKIFCISGTADKKVKNICIRNFDIAYTKGDYRSTHDIPSHHNIPRHPNASDGYASDMQSVFSGWGSIEFEHAYGCGLENNRMYCLGVHAVVVKDGSSGIRITGNDIMHIGAGAITMSGGISGTDEAMHTYRNVITDNRIKDCGNRYFSSCGILLCHSYENTVAHNEISYLYYTGISCGWVWGYGENISHDNIIEKNHIHHIGQGKLSDMGGVYLLGKQPGTIVRNNLIHDVISKHYGGWALYTDEGSSYITLENNICYNTKSNSYHQHYGSMNTVRNNIFAFSEESPIAASKPEVHLGIIASNNIIVTSDKPVFRVGYEGAKVNGCTHLIASQNNIVFDVTGKKASAVKIGETEYSFEEAKSILGMDIDSVVADPQFEDLGKYNFTLKSTSPAFEKGFKEIDMSDVGVRR